MAARPETGIEMSLISSSPDDPVIRILLMGRKKSGKSSSGNTILGERKFKKHHAEVCDAVTQISGKQVAVIDCPDVLDPDLKKEKLEITKDKLVSQCSAGLSSILITVPLEQPVKNEEELLDFIKSLFGCEVQKYIMILFTRGDELEELDEPQTINEYLQKHEDLQLLVNECGGKFHCFNNKRESVCQIKELLQKIEEMIMENGGKFIMKQMKRSGSKDHPGVNFLGEDPYQSNVIPQKEHLRLVLLGKTGSGKSATGNTIIGRKVFDSSASLHSVTKQCQRETTVRNGKEIAVIDTPGLYDTELSEDEVITEIRKCIRFASPGPHAFLFIIKLGRLTKEEKKTIKLLKSVFGRQILKYTMIIFTHKDKFETEKENGQQFLEHCDPVLQSFIRRCGNRFFSLDNESDSFQQFKNLLATIGTMVAENGGAHFTHDVFERTDKYIKKFQRQKIVYIQKDKVMSVKVMEKTTLLVQSQQESVIDHVERESGTNQKETSCWSACVIQ